MSQTIRYLERETPRLAAHEPHLAIGRVFEVPHQHHPKMPWRAPTVFIGTNHRFGLGLTWRGASRRRMPDRGTRGTGQIFSQVRDPGKNEHQEDLVTGVRAWRRIGGSLKRGHGPCPDNVPRPMGRLMLKQDGNCGSTRDRGVVLKACEGMEVLYHLPHQRHAVLQDL